MARSVRAAVAAGVLAFGSVVVVGTSAPGFAEGDDTEGTTATACDPSAAFLDEDACDPADGLPLPSEVIPGFTQDAVTRFAGNFLDRSGPSPVQVFLFTGATSADQTMVDSITGGAPNVEVRSAAFPLSLLNTVQELLTTLLAPLPGDYLIGQDEQGNRLVANVANQAGVNLINTTLNNLGVSADIISVSIGGTMEGTALTRDSYPPHVGGLRVHLVHDNGGAATCTTGLSIKSNASGAHMGLTAGHCAQGYLKDEVWIGANHYLSRSGQNSFRGKTTTNADAMRYSVPSGDAWAPKIFIHGTTNDYRWVTAQWKLADIQQSTKLCFQGETSDNNNCGTPIVKKASGTWDGVEVTDLVEIKYPGALGDSGGPVYSVRGDGTAKVAGTVSMRVADSTHYVLFSPIEYSLAAVDASLIFH